jgi:hypothetical protein
MYVCNIRIYIYIYAYIHTYVYAYTHSLSHTHINTHRAQSARTPRPVSGTPRGIIKMPAPSPPSPPAPPRVPQAEGAGEQSGREGMEGGGGRGGGGLGGTEAHNIDVEEEEEEEKENENTLGNTQHEGREKGGRGCVPKPAPVHKLTVPMLAFSAAKKNEKINK